MPVTKYLANKSSFVKSYCEDHEFESEKKNGTQMMLNYIKRMLK